MNKRRGLSTKLTIAMLFFLFSVRRRSTCTLVSAHKAVSDPEKKPERKRSSPNPISWGKGWSISMLNGCQERTSVQKCRRFSHSYAVNAGCDYNQRRLETCERGSTKRSKIVEIH